MHEVSLCESVLMILEAHAKVHGYQRVKTVWLEIGSLAAVDPEAMNFSFDAVMKGTLAEGAKLEIIEVPGEARCYQCNKTVALRRLGDPCPECGSYDLEIIEGEGMRIKDVSVV